MRRLGIVLASLACLVFFSSVNMALADPIECSLLVVDKDDNDPDVQSMYTDALDALSITYDLIDVSAGAEPPRLADVMPYDVILWFTGDRVEQVGPSFKEFVRLYLNAGGGMLMISEGWLNEEGLNQDIADYFGIADVTLDVGTSSLAGQAGDPIGDGFPAVSLTYPAGFVPGSDEVVADGTTSVAFLNDSGNSCVVDKQGNYRTAFFGASWTAIYEEDQTQGEDVLQASLDFACDASPRMYVEAPVRYYGCSGELLPVGIRIWNLTHREETFTIAIESEWTAEGPTEIGPIGHGMSERATFEVEIPAELNPGELNLMVITVTSVGSPVVEQQVFIETWTAAGVVDSGPETLNQRYDSGLVYHDGNAILVGGKDRDGNVELITEMWSGGNEWTELAPMPSPGLGSARGLTVYLDQIFIPGNIEENSLYVYDIATDNWTVEAMPITVPAAEDYSVVTHGGAIYRLGGWTGDGVTANCHKWMEQTGWLPIASMNIPRANFCAWVFNDNIYVAGGEINETDLTDSTEVYSLADDNWISDTTVFAFLPEGAALGQAANFINQPAIISGKFETPGSNGKVWVYRWEDNAWVTEVQDVPEIAQGGVANVDEQMIYIAAGVQGAVPGGSQMFWNLMACNPPVVPTPTVAPTEPPPPTKTATVAPDTPTPTPPENTPTPTNPPTDTPVMNTVTPTPSDCTTFGVVECEIPYDYVSPGETFYMIAHICNPGDPVDQAPFVGMLDVGIGQYWFFPTWVQYPPDFAFQPVDLPTGMSAVQVLPEFPWPDTGSTSFEGINIYCALLTQDMTAIDGEFCFASFGYGPP